MSLSHFVNLKTKQLVYFIKGFLNGHIPYREVNLFVWDTLEEWKQLKCAYQFPISEQEQAFWHLMFVIHSRPAAILVNNIGLKQELSQCLAFLEHGGVKPKYCIGLRP